MSQRPSVLVLGGNQFDNVFLGSFCKNFNIYLVTDQKLEGSDQYPALVCISEDRLEGLEVNIEAVIILDALSPIQSKDERELFERNLARPLRICQWAKAHGARKFINVSSAHLLVSDESDTAYLRSRSDLVRQLSSLFSSQVCTIYKGSLYHGTNYSGKLKFLNRLPLQIRSPLGLLVRAFTPTTKVCDLIQEIQSELLSDKVCARIIATDGQCSNFVFLLFKACMDYAVSLILVMVFWWLFLLAWLAVRLESRGSGIFVQPRIGYNGTKFDCMKFRSMKVETPSVGTHDVNPSSVTRVGKFLRHTKIDELPQVWNIFRGEMSLIGPRPCLPIQDELIQARNARNVDAIKPGISGLAQVNQVDMADPNLLAEWDEAYLKLRCISLDLKIMIKTVLGKGSGDKTKC